MSVDKENTHLSVTQLKMFLRCPLQYYFRYIKELIIPPRSEVTLGKSIHRALEENYKQKIETKEDLPIDYLTDLFSDTWESEVKETLFEEDEKPGKIKDEGVNILRIYHKIVSPKIQPVYVEKEFNLFLDADFTLKGFIDLVTEEDLIIDHKTTKRSYSEEQVATDLQLTAYSLAYRMLEGKEERGLRFDVMVRTKEPKIQHISTKRTQEDINRFLKLVDYVNKAIKTGIFYPRENFMCPKCGYKELCRRW